VICLKIKQRTGIIIGFTLGALLFATTALADIMSKSGYDQLKDGIKTLAHKASTEYDSLTFEATMVAKVDGKIFEMQSNVEKYDRLKNAKEANYTQQDAKGKVSKSYSYSDSNTSIYMDEYSDKIYVNQFEKSRDVAVIEDPFAEEEFKDIERIIDAVVGNLKDHVIVNENPDGTKELSGSLSEMQIPALVNAVSSYVLKQEFRHGNDGMPQLTQDIAVKSVTGSAVIDQDGALKNVLASATVTGKDNNDQTHEMSLEILLNVKDINSTVVTKPDLTGKDVVVEIINDYNSLNNPEKYIGTYKNQLIIDENKFVKAGERILEITKIDSTGITGHYYEVIKPEYQDSLSKAEEFDFQATFRDMSERDATFTVTLSDGNTVEGYIYLDYGARVNFYFDRNYGNSRIITDGMFVQVLE